VEDHQAILQVLSEYFAGLFSGDVGRLRAVFAPEAALFAELDSASYHKSLNAYLEGVAQRVPPEARGESFRMRVLSVDVLHNIAMAKVHVPALGFNFYNFLSLVRRDGRWLIVNKVFGDAPAGT
jgi:hypothetical protein